MLDFEQSLKSLIIKNSIVDIGTDNINDNIDLLQDLGYDSVRFITLIVEIEATFNIEFDDDDMIISKVTYQFIKETVLKLINNKELA